MLSSITQDDAQRKRRWTADTLGSGHRCHVLEFRGSSYRFRESLASREGWLDEASVTPSPD